MVCQLYLYNSLTTDLENIPVINSPPDSRGSKTTARRSRVRSLLRDRQWYHTHHFHAKKCASINIIHSHRNLRSISNISTARLPQPTRRVSQLPRHETWHKLVHLGIPRRRHGLPRLRGLRAHPPLPLARPPSTAIRAYSQHNGQHAELATATRRGERFTRHRQERTGCRRALQSRQRAQWDDRMRIPDQPGGVEEGRRAATVYGTAHANWLRGRR